MIFIRDVRFNEICNKIVTNIFAAKPKIATLCDSF